MVAPAVVAAEFSRFPSQIKNGAVGSLRTETYFYVLFLEMQLRSYSPVRSICTKANPVIMSELSELNQTHFVASAVEEPFWEISLPMSMIMPTCVLVLSMFFLVLVKLAT